MMMVLIMMIKVIFINSKIKAKKILLKVMIGSSQKIHLGN